MLYFIALCLLCAKALAQDSSEHYSYSLAVGSGTGTGYATPGLGRITAVRIWELPNSYITGLQLRYDYIWGPRVGRDVSNMVEMILFEGETFTQVSGKYNPSNYIFQLCFTTTRGRSVTAGQPNYLSFNHHPSHPASELRQLSGRFNGNGITSIGAHWGLLDLNFPATDHNNSTSLALK